MDNPDINDWKKLFLAAAQFQQTAPWTWMHNDDLFAVENPEGGELAYCSILGDGGQEFGLGIFMGEKGYARYLDIISSDSDEDDFEKQLMTPMLSFLLANREDMQKQDMDVVRSLGLKFRGRNAWPLFRSQEPGYAPWFLNTKEANFLTVIIDRALAVSEKVRINNLDLFEEVDDDKVYTCFYRYNQWKEEWRKPEISHDNPLSLERDLNPVNEAELLLLSNKAGKPSGAWELDLFMIPAPIGPPGSRPYFPLCFMAVEKKQGLIIGNQMTEPWITIAEKRDVIIQMIGKIGLIPRSIFVRSPQVEKILAPIAKTLGVNLQVGPLPLLEEARDSMQNYFSGKV